MGDHDFLLCRCGPQLVALPVREVVETMRAYDLRSVGGAPKAAAVLGVAVVRGLPTPVVDTGALIGEVGAPTSRWVTVRVGDIAGGARRVVVLAVSEIVGVRTMPSAGELPPLLRDSAAETLAELDGELVVVLRSARVVPSSFNDEALS